MLLRTYWHSSRVFSKIESHSRIRNMIEGDAILWVPSPAKSLGECIAYHHSFIIDQLACYPSILIERYPHLIEENIFTVTTFGRKFL